MLKVHKNDNFLAPILNFVLFHCLFCLNIEILYKQIFDWAMNGAK
jgi:hypothetical protein